MRTLIWFLALSVAASAGLGHDLGKGERSDPDGPLLHTSIPISRTAQRALTIVTGHLECSIEEYLGMAGVNIPKGGSCRFDPKSENLDLFLTRENTEVAVMLMGDMMLFTARIEGAAEATKEQVLERYAWEGEKAAWWGSKFDGFESKE